MTDAGTTVDAALPYGPPQPNGFDLVPTPASGLKVNQPVAVAWTVTGATSCVGTAQLDGSAAQLPGWTTATGTSSPRTVTPGQAGNWQLQLDCQNQNGHVLSKVLALTVEPAAPTGCPAGRQTSVTVCYNAALTNCFTVSGDMKFDDVWGRWQPGEPTLPFPALPRLLTFKNLDKTKYLAIEIPAAQLPALLQQGIFTHGETHSGPNMTMSISTACGDFAPTKPYCSKTNVTAGARLGTYVFPGSAYWGCEIASNQRYFINIKATDPNATHVDCVGKMCNVAIQNLPPSK